MSYITGFYKGRLGIGLTPTMGMGDGNPRFPLDINGDIRLTGDIMNENGISLLGSSANGTFVLTDFIAAPGSDFFPPVTIFLTP